MKTIAAMLGLLASVNWSAVRSTCAPCFKHLADDAVERVKLWIGAHHARHCHVFHF